MTQEEYFERMIEIQEERNYIIEKALFPMGGVESVFQLREHYDIVNHREMQKVVFNLEDISKSLKNKSK